MDVRYTIPGLLLIVSLTLVATLAMALLAPTARAAWPPLANTGTSYQLQDESTAAFIERFFEAEGLPVVISPAVQALSGTLSGPREGSADEILSSIADSNQLAIYYDGAMTHVYRNNEVEMRYLSLPRTQLAAFSQLIGQLGLSDRWDQVRINGDAGLVSVRGTPRFIQQVQQLASSATVAPQAPAETTFRYFPLKYAWAGDTVFTVGNRNVAVPGVATLLQQLLGTGVTPTGGVQIARPSSQPLRGRGLAGVAEQLGLGTPTAASDYAAGGIRLEEPEHASSLALYAAADPNQPRIVADPYRNAVIVRDEPQRMHLYEELIRTLDIPSAVVEIEATIFDVNTGRMEELGIDWRLAGDRYEVLFGSKDDLSPAQANEDIDALPQAISGFQIGAIIGNGAEFIARINALATDDLTQVTAQPRVVTLNDVEAVIESSRTVYVPVEGAFDVDLFNVFAGTVLRVTPHIVEEDGQTHIRLLVSVEDGDVEMSTTTSGDTVSQVPIVTRNAVNTQAMIAAGQSLLLGGLDRDVATRSVSKVPILGDIPGLGRLFRNDSNSTARSERMFLISPRLVVQTPAVAPTLTTPTLTTPTIEASPPPAASDLGDQAQSQLQRRKTPRTTGRRPRRSHSSRAPIRRRRQNLPTNEVPARRAPHGQCRSTRLPAAGNRDGSPATAATIHRWKVSALDLAHHWRPACRRRARPA